MSCASFKFVQLYKEIIAKSRIAKSTGVSGKARARARELCSLFTFMSELELFGIA